VLEHGGGIATAYTDAVHRHFGEFLALRAAHCAAERRWPDAPFWAARR
jgi:hypothetical protein